MEFTSTLTANNTTFNQRTAAGSMHLSKCFRELHIRILEARIPFIYGKRRPGIGKRPRYSYLKFGNTKSRGSVSLIPAWPITI